MLGRDGATIVRGEATGTAVAVAVAVPTDAEASLVAGVGVVRLKSPMFNLQLFGA
jgi:hypothetical protein